MIVVDTSAFITLATAEILATVLEEFDVHTTETVILELEETAEYDDIHGEAAGRALEFKDDVTVVTAEDPGMESSRMDEGEASCVSLTWEMSFDFLITDDIRALPELQTVSSAEVAISPIVLKALVKRSVLERPEAMDILDRIVENRGWLGSPIYRRARDLFE